MPAAKKAPPVWEREFSVGDRYRCTVRVDVAHGGTPSGIRVEWEPHVPRGLSDFELSEYVRGRDAALAAFTRESGFAVGVLTV
jgi:hypothetical protein